MSGHELTFNTVPTIICRAGALEEIGPLALARLGTSVLVVTDGGLSKTSMVTELMARLAERGVKAHLFADVVADPPAHIVLAAAEMARANSVEGVIGIGGGSSLDAAKLAAVLAGSGDQPLDALYGVGKVTGKRLPLLLAPTTAGTGSEVTPVAIVTTGEHQKMGVSSPVLLPDIALLDPLATLGLPQSVTAATGIDAMVHAIEAYTSASPANNPLSRMLAEQALTLLSANIRTAFADGGNIQARTAMLLGAMLAGQAFANSPVAAVHALAYPIGSRFHIPHGVSNALVLLPVMRFNQGVCGDGYAAIAAFAFPELAGLGKAERVEGLIVGLAAIVADTGTPARLRDVGIKQDDLQQLATDAMEQTRLLGNNPRNVTFADALAIYNQAW